MNIIEIIAAWNAQADYMNKWDSLGEAEKLEWAMKHEREACANLGEKLLLPETFFETTYEHDAHKDALLSYRNAIHARGTT